jgi:hypothetical protein
MATTGQKVSAEFSQVWRARFSLPKSAWRAVAKAHLAKLPFPRPAADLALLAFLFDDLPARVACAADSHYRAVAVAFGWLCYQFWQAEAAFPSYSESYAGYLRDVLVRGQIDAQALALARLINTQEEPGHCGFNQLVLADVAAVRQGEAWKKEGRFEPFLKAHEKYEEYVAYLKNHAGFRTEWAAVKAAFPEQVAGQKIIRRSLVPERSWYQGRGAQFGTIEERFQAVFDVLCWKYYLWGIEGNRPLLMKPTVAATPFGTQIFIPGYLSFDAKRDLDLALLGRLHRARGAARQGPGFSEARQAEIANRTKAGVLDREARRLGLRGDARWRFITLGLGKVDSGDYRETRRLLAGK